MNVRIPLVLLLPFVLAAQAAAETPANLRDENLVAWCIVPFDGKNRGPAERAEMIKRLGLRRVAYDWRQQHVPTFEEEIKQYEQHGIEYFAFWGAHDDAFRLFEKYDLHPQIWQTLNEGKGTTDAEKVADAAKAIEPLAKRTAALGCKLGLYNHGGWGGEPENMIAVCQRLREQGHDNVGIVYNLHHGHGHLDDFAAVLARMKPYLLCLNLNGMNKSGDERGEKILPLGAGELDVKLLKAIADSGYDGPIGVIGHTQDDVELRLRDNLDGLHWILPQLDGKSAGKTPEYRTWEAQEPADDAENAQSSTAPDYSPQVVGELLESANNTGDAHRGLMVFSSAKSACLSCHRIGKHGGSVGPELTAIAKQRKPEELVESVLWPKRDIKPEFRATMIVEIDGRTHQGYVVKRGDRHIVLRDPTKTQAAAQVHQAIGHSGDHAARPQHAEITIATADVELERDAGTLMPENLTAAMSEQQLADLLRFVATLGTEHAIPDEELDSLLMHAQAHLHGPATFEFVRDPLEPPLWPSWRHHINRDRLYDFYAKQAEHFRTQSPVPPLLMEYPGLDGGSLGHWGNQDDTVWADGRWNETILSSVQCGIFHGGGATVLRGVCVRLGEPGELSVCFNPDTLTYDALWSGGFVKFSPRRKGFLGGVEPDGKLLPRPAGKRPTEPFEYHGFYRHGDRVVFAYRIGDTEYLDVPGVESGRFTRTVGPVDEHPLRDLIKNAPPQWPEKLETSIKLGEGHGYVIDTIELPTENPWKALFYCGGHAFLPDGSALVCTMQGDVWRVSGFEHPSRTAVWRRYAAGLHQSLGIVADDDGIFVLGRDQITRLHDLNDDGEADYYECFSNAYQTSPGHDFVCGLERDAAGNFYTASGPQGLIRISPDGKNVDVLATGFRNPDGLGLLPDGTVTVPCSEGSWTPASMICAVRPQKVPSKDPPHFGYPGPRNDEAPALPLVYLPRGLDNSAGGQTYIDDDRFGPLSGQLVHFSFGAGAAFLILRDEVDGRLQGAAVPIAGEFRSGAHRGRTNPADGQLYVTGMQGWGSYTSDDGCFQRVRHVERNSFRSSPVQLPTNFHVHENGITISFAAPLDADVAAHAASHFAQCWNYRYGPGYGSPEFSTRHFGIRGHDALAIRSAHILPDGKTLFLELPELQPVNQLHLCLQTTPGEFHDLFATVHKLDKPFTDFSGYEPEEKTIAPHPILADLAMAVRSVPNPYQKPLEGARKITIKTGGNLSYQTRTIRVRAGEPLALTLANPDVVPHNWALAKPGRLERVGDLANRLISDPEAALRHYIPATDDILAHTDVVLPQDSFTIHFRAPKTPGRYPYLCTFPGHWKVMNGEMIVE